MNSPLIFQRIKSPGIAHNSYFISMARDAVVIDPRRDCDVYVDLAREHNTRIRAVLETHRNEDYVVGSMELASLTGCEVYHGPGLPWGYGSTLADGQQLQFGEIRMVALHTPGHTEDSVSYVLLSPTAAKVPMLAFTGDTLFIQDVGRTDLFGPDNAHRLAAALYDSLFGKILPLGEGVILCPAHGAGSVCGAAIAEWDEGTLGIERTTNPWLQLTREDFVARKTAESLDRPPYFDQMEIFNLNGAPLLRGNLPDVPVLTARQAAERISGGAVVVDTSDPAAFAGAHIPNAYSIWLEGLPSFAGWILPFDKPLMLVVRDGVALEQALRSLVRLGYDNYAGCLPEGTEPWYVHAYPIARLDTIAARELYDRLQRKDRLFVLDVRRDDEFREGHIDGAVHIYVGYLERQLDDVPRDVPVMVTCAVGLRGSLACSILQRAGFDNVTNVLGGMLAWKAASLPTVASA